MMYKAIGRAPGRVKHSRIDNAAGFVKPEKQKTLPARQRKNVTVKVNSKLHVPALEGVL